MFQYFLKFDTVKIEVNPIGIDRVTLVAQRERGQRFYREKLNGNFKIGGRGRMNEYEILYSIERSSDRCRPITFSIENTCTALVEWEGIFTCNDVKWDVKNCVAEIKQVEPDDPYNNFLANWDQKRNILAVNPANSIDIDNTGRIASLVDIEWSYVGTGAGWTFVDLFIFDPDAVPVFARNTAGTPPGFAGFSVEVEVNDTGVSPGANYSQVHSEQVNGTTYFTWWLDMSVTQTYSRGRDLLEVLNYLVSEIDSNLSHANFDDISTFFADAVNYVTNGANRVERIKLFQMTDVLFPNASNPASSADYSLKQIMEDLEDLFNVFWFIDENGKFRIEHESFEMPSTESGQFDDSFDDSFYSVQGFPVEIHQVIEPKGYEYLKEEIPRLETWQMNNVEGADFVGLPIRYSNNCANGEREDVFPIRHMSTDLEAILFGDPDEFPKEGLFLLANNDIVTYNEVGAISTKVKINNHLSIANLLDTYHRDKRPFTEGILNGVNTVFDSTINIKLQKGIKIPYCCGITLNYDEIFTTCLGEGKLEKVTKFLKSGMLEIDVVHPYETGLPDYNPTGQFDDSHSDSFL